MEPKLYAESLLKEERILTIPIMYNLTGVNYNQIQAIFKSVALLNGKINPSYQVVFQVVCEKSNLINSLKVHSNFIDKFIKEHNNEIRSIGIYAISSIHTEINDLTLFNAGKEETNVILKKSEVTPVQYTFKQISLPIKEMQGLHISTNKVTQSQVSVKSAKTEMAKPNPIVKASVPRIPDLPKKEMQSKIAFPSSQVSNVSASSLNTKQSVINTLKDTKKEVKVEAIKEIPKVEAKKELKSKPGIQINIDLKKEPKKKENKKKKKKVNSSEDSMSSYSQSESIKDEPFNPKRKHEDIERETKRAKILQSNLYDTHDSFEENMPQIKEEDNKPEAAKVDAKKEKQYEKVKKIKRTTKEVTHVDEKGYTVTEDVTLEEEYYEDVEIVQIENKKGKAKEKEREKQKNQPTIDSFFAKRG